MSERCPDEDTAVFGSVDDDLLGLLHRMSVLRKWTEREVASVIRKLLAIEVRDTYTLVLQIRCSVLQQRLKRAGQKTFKKETLLQFRDLSGFVGPSATSLAAAAAARREQAVETEDEPLVPYAPADDTLLPPTPQSVPSPAALPELEAPAEDVPEADVSDVLQQSACVRRIIEMELGYRSEAAEPAAVQERSIRMTDMHLLSPIRTRAVWRVIEVPLDWLYFYQTCVAGCFSDGIVLQTTVDQLRSGYVTPYTLPLMHTLVVDGMLYGMGTRRLLCFHMVWGKANPSKLIPVLFCNHSTQGVSHNHEGITMRMFGQTQLDGEYRHSVSRTVPSRKVMLPSCEYLQEHYAMGRIPIKRDDSAESWYQ